jgi:hypothetical protein
MSDYHFNGYPKEEINQKWCQCGGVILADTEEWSVPLCYACWEKATAQCFCKNGIRGKYCLDFHVKEYVIK